MMEPRHNMVDMHEEMKVINSIEKHPWFAFKTERLKSFVKWPDWLKQTPEQLSECGFFHLGQYANV